MDTPDECMLSESIPEEYVSPEWVGTVPGARWIWPFEDGH